MMAHETHHSHQQDKHGTLMSSGFGGYSDFSSSNNTVAIQSFDPGHELLGLQAGMELLGIPSRQQRDHHDNPNVWRGFKPQDFLEASSENLLVASEVASSSNPWQQPNRLMVDDSSLRCLFPSEGSEQPNQGLSLSLCNPNPSNEAELQQSFHLSSNSRESLLSKSMNLQQQQQYFLQDGRFLPASALPPAVLSQQPRMLRNSKYLIPAQELLNEFVNLGGGRTSKPKPKKASQWEEGGPSASWNQSLYSLDFLELQKRKGKLLSILEEVDRRYRKYCEKMRAVVSSFEAVAGEGAATVYSTLASKAMSRHFRCLRDGIVGQIQATKKAMGEDLAAPATARGETPRLKLLDQHLRQQKAFQQAEMMESHPWRPQRGLPERSVSFLRAWLFEHFLHPYPSDVDKHILARQTGLSRSQVSNWFINARVRLWKPMVEEMYMEEIKEGNESSTAGDEDTNGRQSLLQPDTNPNPNASQLPTDEQKPTLGQLLHDSESLSSIINTSHHRDHRDIMSSKDNTTQQQVPRTENFGVVDIDFASSYGNQGFGNGVSLTLGLQQHNGGGMSLSFSPASQHPLFFPREQIENCQPVQLSILEGEAQNLPYRNLMGAQLLHDLAG